MKKILLFLFSLSFYYGHSQVLPNCNAFYGQGSNIVISSLGIPNTTTVTTIPNAGAGLAIGPSFGFPAPNPTFWTTSGGTYWYWNGAAWVNTTHNTGAGGAVNPGGSKNFLYNIVGGVGQVWRYNGTGPGVLLATIPALASQGPYDLVGDDQDNFYYLHANAPQSLLVYDMFGVLTCSYSVTGLTPSTAGGGFAIVGNTVTVSNAGGYHVGVITGTVVNFTVTPSTTLASSGDFASCPLSLTYNSTITAAPSVSITCTNSLVTLSATVPATISPVTYTWSGPGIVTSINNATVNVNAAGVYSCSTKNASCPTRTSIATFTVLNGGTVITPTITSSGNLSCSSSSTQLFVAPNGPPHTYSWTGPGIIGPSTNSVVTVNSAGVYSVTVTNPLTGCAGTRTVNVSSTIAPLTISVSPSNPQKCSTGPAVNLTASGATNYTWSPSATLSSSVGAVVAANPSVTTTYTVFGVTGACSGSAVVTVVVIPTPTVVITSGSPTICTGSSGTLSASGATTYTWNPGGLTGSSISVSPVSTTVYTVTGANGTCTSTATGTVNVVPGPTLTASANPTIICRGNSSTLTVGGASTYTWLPGGLTGTSVVVSPTVTTTYTVNATSVSGCISNRTLTLLVNPNPTVTIAPSSPTICSGRSTTLTASGASSYTWAPGPIISSSIVITPTVNSTYTVTGVLGVCASTNTVFVTVVPAPTVTAVSSPTALCAGNSATLTAVSYTHLNKVVSVQLDPYRETCDINEKNNTWNVNAEPGKFEVFKNKTAVRGQSAGENPMQKAKNK